MRPRACRALAAASSSATFDRFGLARAPGEHSLERMSSARLLAFALGLVALLRAAPEDRMIVAAMQLSDQPNYAWTSTVVDDARSYEVQGWTTKGGYTRIQTPVVNAIRRRLGREVTDAQVEAIFKGNVKCVLLTDDGWRTIDELPRPDSKEPDTVINLSSTPGIARKRSKQRKDESEAGPYSNLQLAVSHPHEELGVLVMNHANLAIEKDVVTGTITDTGARLLLVRDGQPEITPLRGTGTFRLYLRGQAVSRYLIELEGVLAIDTPVGRREITVHQKMDTTLIGIGTTKFDVPEEAKRKLN